MEYWKTKKTEIPLSVAENILCRYIHDADADDVAELFGHVSGYDVFIKSESGAGDPPDEFILDCTPNNNCGYALGENPDWPSADWRK